MSEGKNTVGRSRSAIIWSFLEKIMKRGVSFVVSMFLARLLSPSDFGLVAMVGFFTVIASVFADLGIGQALVQKKNVTDIQYSTVFYINVFLGVFIYFTLWGAAPYISKFYGEDIIVEIVRLSAFSFIINSFVAVPSAILFKDLKIKYFAYSMVVSNVLSGGLSVIMAYKGWGVWSLVWYGLSGTVIKVTMLWIISKWVPLFRFSIYSIKDIWKTALGFLNIGIINKVLEGLDSLFIGKVFNMAQLGFYNRAKALYELPMYTFLTPITRPFFPIFAKIQDELGEQRRKFYNTVEMLNFITLLGFGLLFILAKNWIVILYSDKWLESVAYFKVLIILIPFYPFNLLSTSLFKGNGKLKLLTIITAIDRAAVIFALIFGLKYGLLEFVYAFVVYKIFVFVFRIFFVQKYLKISSMVVVVSLVKMILVFIVIAVPLHYLNISNIYIETIVKTLIFSVSYMLIGYMFQIEGLLILYKELKNLLFSKK